MTKGETKVFCLLVEESWFFNGTSHHISVGKELAGKIGISQDNQSIKLFADKRPCGTGSLNAQTRFLTGVSEIFSELHINLDDAQKVSIKAQGRHCENSSWELHFWRDGEVFGEETIDSSKLEEGNVRQILVNVHERSLYARDSCIKHHGAACKVCGFNFEDIYGEIGKDFIHVHHLRPLKGIDARYQVDPEKDLVPLCANCHAMAHRRNPSYSVDELKQILKTFR